MIGCSETSPPAIVATNFAYNVFVEKIYFPGKLFCFSATEIQTESVVIMPDGHLTKLSENCLPSVVVRIRSQSKLNCKI